MTQAALEIPKPEATRLGRFTVIETEAGKCYVDASTVRGVLPGPQLGITMIVADGAAIGIMANTKAVIEAIVRDEAGRA